MTSNLDTKASGLGHVAWRGTHARKVFLVPTVLGTSTSSFSSINPYDLNRGQSYHRQDDGYSEHLDLATLVCLGGVQIPCC